MTDMKKCPYCGEEIKIEAKKCRYCHTMLSEEYNVPVGAASTAIPQQTAPKVKKPTSYRASRWTGLISWTKLLMPDQIHIHSDRIEIKKYRLMGLNSTTEEIKYNKIASVRNASGLFFAALIIETSGGATSDIVIKGLKKKQAREAADIIREKAE